MIKKIFLFGSLITSLLASTLITNEVEEKGDVILKNMTGKDDIMNIETVFHDNNVLSKVAKGKGKEKDRKKKPKKRDSSSSSSSEEERERNSRRSRTSRPPIIPNPGQSANEPVMRQQEVVTGGRNSRHTSKEDNATEGEDNVITVTGPIRRKPLIHV